MTVLQDPAMADVYIDPATGEETHIDGATARVVCAAYRRGRQFKWDKYWCKLLAMGAYMALHPKRDNETLVDDVLLYLEWGHQKAEWWMDAKRDSPQHEFRYAQTPKGKA